jgi:glycosyltransferase involved in cell wall biosynthesis
MRAAIVIPALNEAATIAEVVSAVRSHGEVIVVDDGSTDDTGRLARAAGATVVRHDANRGYDPALASGFAHAASAGCDVLISFDADGQHDPALVARMLAPIAAGAAEIVLGARPAPARFSEWLFGGYVRARYGIPDILCGLKAFSASVYRTHARAAERRSINTALALAALRHGARWASVPVPFRPRRDRPRFGSWLQANGRILSALAGAVAHDLRGSRA